MSKEIDKLIEQVLKEKSFDPVFIPPLKKEKGKTVGGTDIDDITGSKGWTDLRQALGLPTSVLGSTVTMDQVKAALGEKPLDQIDKKDLELERHGSAGKKMKDGTIISPFQLNQSGKGGGQTNFSRNAIRAVLWMKFKDEGKLTDEDEKYLKQFYIPGNLAFWQRVPGFLNLYRKDSDEVKGMLPAKHGAIDQSLDKRVEKSPTIADQAFLTGMADEGKMLQSQFYMFKQFWQYNDTGDSLEKKIKALTEFSEFIATAKDAEEMKEKIMGDKQTDNKGNDTFSKMATAVPHFLTNVLVLDMFSTFAKHIDHGAGAYFFEAFLGYIGGGKAGGKEAGAGGGMGEADFRKADGSKGSAKYFQKGSDMAQSAKNFVLNEPVEYIVGYKSDKAGQKTSDIVELYNIDIYRFVVERIGTNQAGDKLRFNIDGKPKDLGKTQTDIDLKPYVKDSTKIGTLVLAQTPKKTLGELVQKQADNMDQAISDAFRAFNELMGAMKQAKEETLTYSTTGKVADGNKALKDWDSVDTQFSNLVGKVNVGKKVTSTASGREIKESKSPLDQLIEAIAKQKLLK